jgi:hypothetical protein
MKEVGRYTRGNAHDAPELIADLADGAELCVSGELAWIPGVKGWRTFEDEGGYTVVAELSSEECIAHLAGDPEALERERLEEERLREQSRQARGQLGPASSRAPR